MPVLLAGVEELAAAFRRISGHEGIVEEPISGNVAHLSASELHGKAWPLVRERLEDRTAKLLERIAASGAEVPVSRELDDVVRAGSDGRVETLFVAVDRECWGRYDEAQREVTRDEPPGTGDYDLLDRAAADTCLKGGHVHAVPASRIRRRAPRSPGCAAERCRTAGNYCSRACK